MRSRLAAGRTNMRLSECVENVHEKKTIHKKKLKDVKQSNIRIDETPRKRRKDVKYLIQFQGPPTTKNDSS